MFPTSVVALVVVLIRYKPIPTPNRFPFESKVNARKSPPGGPECTKVPAPVSVLMVTSPPRSLSHPYSVPVGENAISVTLSLEMVPMNEAAPVTLLIV